MDNAAIAELLVREVKTAEYHWGRVFRRAARSALMWPVEAAELFAAGRPLEELAGIGHWSKVFAEAARLDKAVEIDGDPSRQDLRVSLLELARQEGVRISLGTDAHHPDQLAYMELSLAAALKAKIRPSASLTFCHSST